VNTALEFRGVPYRNGGSDPSGFDCSGFVHYVFAKYGTVLPREVRDQYRAGASVDLDDVVAGDLLFFETVSRGASHVGMVVGAGQFVHAPSSRGVVRVERYDSSYWARRFVGARRVVVVSPAPGELPGPVDASN
jgi:cell wall-associated NlpC family hydrolase